MRASKEIFEVFILKVDEKTFSNHFTSRKENLR